MHLRIAMLAACLGMASTSAAAVDQLLRNVNVIDIASGEISPAQDIVVREGRISELGPTPLAAVGADIHDAGGAYVIPGLWDSHVHVFSSPQEPAAAFPLYLLNGITGIRDMGGLLPLAETKRTAAAVEAGEMLGPRIILSGAWVDASPGSWPGMFLADTPDEARAVVATIKDEGWAAVKSYSMLAEEVYLALAAQAAAEELPLVGHIPESVTLPTAVAAGHDVVEHFGRVTKACSPEEQAMIGRVRATLGSDAPRAAMIAEMAGHNRIVLETWDEMLCDRVIAQMKNAGTYVTPTLIVSDFYVGARPADLEARMALLPDAISEAWSKPDFRLDAMTDELRAIARQSIALDWRTFKRAHDAGVGILAGSDASFANPFIFHGFSLLDEIDRYVAAGLTPQQALFTATIAPAAFLGLSDESGRVAVGMRADLVLLDDNPLVGLETLRQPRAVMVHGTLLDAADLEAMRTTLRGGR